MSTTPFNHEKLDEPLMPHYDTICHPNQAIFLRIDAGNEEIRLMIKTMKKEESKDQWERQMYNPTHVQLLGLWSQCHLT